MDSKSRDAALVAMMFVSGGGMLAAAMGLIPSWAAGLCVLVGFLGVIGVIAYSLAKQGVPAKQIVYGIAIMVGLSAVLGGLSLAYVKFLAR